MTETIRTQRSPEVAATGMTDARRWAILSVLLVGQFMSLVDVAVVNIAMPVVQRDLHASGAALQFIVSGYSVSYAMLLITGARLGDIHGRRRVFLVGVLCFTVSSLVCGLAPTTTVLIVARLTQGAGAAMMMPQVISTIQINFTGAARARALSAYAAVIAVGAVAGVVLGGVLVSANLFGTGWRPVFLINVPVGLAVSILVPRLMPADRPARTQKLDLVGLALSVPAISLIVVPLVLGHQDGWPVWTFACLAAGAVLAVVFVLVERRIDQPLLNLPVFKARGFGSGLATLSAALIAYGGFLFSVALHVQSGLGYSPLAAGLTFAPFGALFGLCGYHWRRLPARWHHALPTVGLLLSGLSYLLASGVFDSTHVGRLAIILSLLPFGIGMGLAMSPLMMHVLVSVPPRLAADASGLVTTTMQLSQVLGVAVFGSLFLTLSDRPQSNASSSAIAVTLVCVAILVGIGALVSLRLARTVRTAG